MASTYNRYQLLKRPLSVIEKVSKTWAESWMGGRFPVQFS